MFIVDNIASQGFASFMRLTQKIRALINCCRSRPPVIINHTLIAILLTNSLKLGR